MLGPLSEEHLRLGGGCTSVQLPVDIHKVILILFNLYNVYIVIKSCVIWIAIGNQD